MTGRPRRVRSLQAALDQLWREQGSRTAPRVITAYGNHPHWWAWARSTARHLWWMFWR